MEGDPSSTENAALPREVRLRVLSLLPPNDLALAGRLSCKDAAQHFSEARYRTVAFRLPVPAYAAGPLEALLSTWTLPHKLRLLMGAPKYGIERNVELVWKVLQPHFFPELLQTGHYQEFLYGSDSDTGSTAVAAGLAHLLPTLERRCPGLLDPCRTLEAAARHCDLAGLQVAWDVVGQRLPSSLQQPDWHWKLRGVWADGGLPESWSAIMAAAASSATPGAIDKMEWVLATGHQSDSRAVQAEVCGEAAASGDLARLRWLRQRGFPWGTGEVLSAVLQHADMRFVLQLEQEGGYLPPGGDMALDHEAEVCAAARAPQDSAAKLRWLLEKGVALDSQDAVVAAAEHGNLEVVQLLLGHWRAHASSAGDSEFLTEIMDAAVDSGSIPTAAWLLQAGCPMDHELFVTASRRGSLDMVRWLMGAGCFLGDLNLTTVVAWWPSRTPADAERLLEAVRLLQQDGCPLWQEDYGQGVMHPLMAAVEARHPWPVWEVLWGMLTRRDPCMAFGPVMCAAEAGCGAVLEGLVRRRVLRDWGSHVGSGWYAQAAKDGDRGTLECLARLGVPLGPLEAAVSAGAPLCALQWLEQHGAD